MNTPSPSCWLPTASITGAVMLVLVLGVWSEPLLGSSIQADNSSEVNDSPSVQDPFAWFDEIPDQVDAAAVFNNPAERFLLKDSGRSIRKLLAISGVFSQSEHAWDALAKVFQADPDDTIRSLLGKRVVVVWDGIGSSSDSIFGLAKEVDSHWTLVSEVDSAYLRQIREHLKPVRRRIQNGHAVYAIEQGRYEIVLLNENATGRGKSLVLLAPKKGSSLLDHVLGSFVESAAHQDPKDRSAKRAHRSILQGREELATTLSDDLDGEADWSVAWIVQLDRLLARSQNRASKAAGGHAINPSSDPEHSAVLFGILSPTRRGGRATIATDLQITLPEGNAPVGMLSAVGGDAVLAIAMAQIPNIFLKDHSIEIASFLGSPVEHPEPTKGSARSEFLGGPGLVLLTEIPDNSSPQDDPGDSGQVRHLAALTMMVQLADDGSSDQSAQSSPGRVDRAMNRLLSSFDPSQAPKFDGRFPDAIRTHSLDLTGRTDATGGAKGETLKWPGDYPRLSWLATEISGKPAMIASIGPDHAKTAKQVRWIAEAAENLDAIPGDHDPEGVLTSGYIRPNRMLSLMDSSSTIDLAISRLIDRIDWEITRTPFGFRGSSSIRFADLAPMSKLGNDQSR